MPQFRTPGPTAAIAAIVPGVQAQGVWMGRRQLFVRFAAEAETATLFTSEMLARQLARAVGYGALHSISLTGRDPLAAAPLIASAFALWTAPIPVMLDSDGQRPESLPELLHLVTLVQVTVDFTEPVLLERALATLAATAAAGREAALVLVPRPGTTDGQILRLIEQAHASVPGTKLVVHPPSPNAPGTIDPRYGRLLEQATTLHPDVTMVMRVPVPVGVR
jgi:organic radical activating enzyme